MTARYLPKPESEPRPATLIVSRSSTTCGRCGKGTRIAPTHHIKVVGYGVSDTEQGCGERFTAITTDQLGPASSLLALVEMRPDLPLIIPESMTIPGNPDAAAAERELHAVLDAFRGVVADWKNRSGDDPELHRVGEQRYEEAHAAAKRFDETIDGLRRRLETET